MLIIKMGKSLDMNNVNCALLVVVLILVVVCCVKPTEGFEDMVKKSRLTECQAKRDLCWKNKRQLEERMETHQQRVLASGDFTCAIE
jgi:hypothetical protein